MDIGLHPYHRFFVYGTLLPGQPNEHFWLNGIVEIEAALLEPAQLVDFGTFPMLIEPQNLEQGPAPCVFGQLVTVDSAVYERVLAGIDRLEDFDPANPENSVYRRVLREVRTSTGRAARAWVYIGRPELAKARPFVTGGDWVTYCREHKDPGGMASWWLENGLDLLFGNFSDSE